MNATAVDGGGEGRPFQMKLLAARLPLPDESCSSWVQRLCGDHEYSMLRLEGAFGFSPPARDWDLPIPIEVWKKLVASTDSEHAPHLLALRVLATLVAHSEGKQLLLSVAGRPQSRVCPSCLRSDEIPYFRWHWRLAAVKKCWIHRVPLLEHCSACSAPVSLHRSRLVAVGRGGLAWRLDGCDSCGMEFQGEAAFSGSYNRAAQWRIEEALKCLLGVQSVRVLQDSAFAAAQFVGATDLSAVPVSKARALSYLDRWRHAKAEAAAWVLNGEVFRKKFDPPASHTRDWHSRVGPRERMEIASALWMIRQAKREASWT